MWSKARNTRMMYCDNESCPSYTGVRVRADGDGWNEPITYPSECEKCGSPLQFEEDSHYLYGGEEEDYGDDDE